MGSLFLDCTLTHGGTVQLKETVVSTGGKGISRRIRQVKNLYSLPYGFYKYSLPFRSPELLYVTENIISAQVILLHFSEYISCCLNEKN
ncbi:hypothetical protein GIB67_024104 [Kingdonia uniflora]|uniref:Uncharacterized protein n=1 Tax=Kingdonia uniflora TaxID=39325 RepID=A0A7J7MMU8_9MAGN|nr:hypothetical protein GIB67_024104 [Kingdonia uniflora]